MSFPWGSQMNDENKKPSVVEYDGPRGAWSEQELVAIVRDFAELEAALDEAVQHGKDPRDFMLEIAGSQLARIHKRMTEGYTDYSGSLEGAIVMSHAHFSDEQLSQMKATVADIRAENAALGWAGLIARYRAMMEPDSIFALSGSEGPGAEHWYQARIAVLGSELFGASDKALAAAEIGYQIGFLYRDAWWRHNHEDAAAAYYKRMSELKDGGTKGAKATKDRFADLKERVLDLVRIAVKEKGADFAFANQSIQATTVRQIAERGYPGEFTSPQGGQLREQWFKEALEHFHSEGRLQDTLMSAINQGKSE